MSRARRVSLHLAGLVLVVGLGLGVRLAHLRELMRHDPLFGSPSLDSEYYDQLARDVAGGDLLGGDELFVHSPGYAYALAAVYRARGEDAQTPFPRRDYAWPRRVQALLGALTCGLAAILAWQLAGAAAGLGAGLVAACYGPLVFHELELMPPVLLTPLITLALIGVCSIARSAAGRAGLVRWAGVGLALGAAAVVRPNIVLFVPPLVVWGGLDGRRRGLDVGQRLAGLVLLAAGLAAPIGLLTWRNHAVSGRWVPFVVKGGFNLYLGNNPDYPATARLRPGAAFNAIYRKPLDEAGLTDPVAQDRWFRQAVLAEARRRPAAFAARLAGKLRRVFVAHEEQRNRSLEVARDRSWVLRATVWPGPGPALPFGLLGPLGLLGLCLARRRAGPGGGPVVLFVVCYAVSVALFYTAGRYRLPLIPALLALAAVGVAAGVRAGRWRRLAGVLAALAIGAALTAPRAPVDPAARAERLFYEARAAARRGDGSVARHRLVESLAVQPLWYVYFELSLLLAPEPASAARCLERALALDPRQWAVHHNLGLLRLDAGQPAAAAHHFAIAAELDHRPAEPLWGLGRLAERAGDLDRARGYYLAALRRRPGFAPAERGWRRVTWGRTR